MKKLFLSFVTIVLFLAYGFFQRSMPQATPIATASPQTDTTSPPTPTQFSSGSTPPPQKNSGYKDGVFTGDVTDAFYGNVQVRATIQNGKIVDVFFLQYPNDRHTSMMISMMSMPSLKQEALSAQSSKVDIVSGATDTSQAFIESLGSALAQAL